MQDGACLRVDGAGGLDNRQTDRDVALAMLNLQGDPLLLDWRIQAVIPCCSGKAEGSENCFMAWKIPDQRNNL